MGQEHREKPVTEVITPQVVLPGEYDEDTLLVDQAVDDINALLIRRGLETTLEVGEYLVRTFFGGSIEAHQERSDRDPRMT